MQTRQIYCSSFSATSNRRGNLPPSLCTTSMTRLRKISDIIVPLPLINSVTFEINFLKVKSCTDLSNSTSHLQMLQKPVDATNPYSPAGMAHSLDEGWYPEHSGYGSSPEWSEHLSEAVETRWKIWLLQQKALVFHCHLLPVEKLGTTAKVRWVSNVA